MELSNFNFSCPHCHHTVVKNDSIELVTNRFSGEQGLIRMDSKIGNYSFEHIPPLSFTEGESIRFSCPFCAANLTAEDYPDYALLTMDMGNGMKFDVIFSRIAGKRETRIITEDGIETYTG